jgi:hypothetical protein
VRLERYLPLHCHQLQKPTSAPANSRNRNQKTVLAFIFIANLVLIFVLFYQKTALKARLSHEAWNMELETIW